MAQFDLDSADGIQAISATALPLPTGASTSVLQTTGNTSLSSIDTKTPALGQALAAASTPVVLTAAQIATLTPLSTVAVTGPLTDTQLRATAVPVSGTFFQATQPVSIAATVAVSGPLTDTQLRASAVPVSVSGVATAANQAAEIASLASIDAGIPAALGQTTMAASMPVTMAVNQSSIPVSVQSVISGGDELATFSVLASGIAIGNNKSMLSIANALLSTKVLKLRELYIVNAQNVPVTGIIAGFSLEKFTSHSLGTVIVPQSYDSADSLNSSLECRTGATIVGAAAVSLKKLLWSSDEWGPGASDVESLDHASQVGLNLIKQFKGCKPITIRVGEGIHIKQTTNSTVGTFDVLAVFTQE